MHDRLPPRWMCLWSRGIFKFWEISDGISETVQDRDSCNGRLIGNRMGLSNGTITNERE